jgi:predicted Zn-dependent peptidase
MGEDGIRREVIGDLAAEVLLGEASELYLQMYEEGLIDSSFGGGFEVSDGCALLTCGGDSDDALAVRDAIIRQAEKIAKTGVDQQEFLRLKRSALGRRIRDLDSFSSTCFRLCAYACSDYDYFSFPSVYETVTTEDVRRFLAEHIRFENCAISLIHPKEDML